ncbi:MAG: phosphotransferase [Jatrophihabitans sp.]|uniref:phosphotransferase n=1 Tax=Jatrophihabitans sp. TaxID=1932789 RepID=UPI00390DE8D7
MTDDLEVARALLPSVRLEPLEELRGGERSSVQRVHATYPDGNRSTLVVKRYLAAGEGWVRESAALSVLPASVPAPRVVAVGDQPPVLITDDLGGGGSVADALLGTDPALATAAVVGWARAIATLHVATAGSRQSFRDAVDERQGDLPVAESRMSIDLEDAIRVLDRECGALGVRVPAGAFEELRGVGKRLGASGPAALTPADTCPDNNVAAPSGLALLDFEGAEWRHLAWDVAYLLVPWPTCWCSWRLPAAVADQALDAYRRVAAAAFPQVAEPGFAADLDAAVLGWALLSTSWFIDNALGSDAPANPEKPTPTRRAMIMHRLESVAGSREVPAAAELAGRLAGALHTRWGDVPLAYARAFTAAQ